MTKINIGSYDKGLNKYKKYIASCVLARNIQTLGKILFEEERKKQKKLA